MVSCRDQPLSGGGEIGQQGGQSVQGGQVVRMAATASRDHLVECRTYPGARDLKLVEWHPIDGLERVDRHLRNKPDGSYTPVGAQRILMNVGMDDDRARRGPLPVQFADADRILMTELLAMLGDHLFQGAPLGRTHWRSWRWPLLWPPGATVGKP